MGYWEGSNYIPSDYEQAQSSGVQNAVNNAYKDGNYSGLNYNPDITKPEVQGEIKGSIDASRYYGQQSKIGEDSQDYTQRLKNALNGNSANADKYLTTQNRSNGINAAKAGLAGVDNTALSEQNRRNTLFQAEAQNQEYRDSALKAYGQNVGARISGTEALKATGSGKELAAKPVAGVSYDTGLLGTVICTVLWKKGYMSTEIYILDQSYGIQLREEKPHVYEGYRFLADPIVKIMNKSDFFTKIISIPGMAWANNMAGNKNLLGSIISIFGESLCGIIGKILIGVKNESSI